MASDNETVAEIVIEMRIFKCRNLASGELENCVTTQHYFADRIEAAYKREVAELHGERNGILKANTSLAADNDRLRREVAELRCALKKAYGTLYSISCSRYGEGLTCTDDIHELVTMARECSDELYASENLRKALEGANHELH